MGVAKVEKGESGINVGGRDAKMKSWRGGNKGGTGRRWYGEERDPLV